VLAWERGRMKRRISEMAMMRVGEENERRKMDNVEKEEQRGF